MTEEVYLDYNASSPLDPRVAESMMPVQTEMFGNASSAHRFGRRQNLMVEEAREQVAELVGCQAGRVVFTGGATEANNLALKGITFGASQSLPRILVSAAEHSSVLGPALWLKERGLASLDLIPVEAGGGVDVQALEGLLGPDVLLVSVMSANGETGVLNPVEQVAEMTNEVDVLFHCDVTQSIGRLPFDFDETGIDLVTLSGHKICGPTGIGAMVASNRVMKQMQPLIHGGGHEKGLRSGSLNVAGIVGFGVAAQIASKEKIYESERVGTLRDALVAGLKSSLTGVSEIGDVTRRLPNTACIRFHNVDAEAIVSGIDPVAISAGSACNSGSIKPSEVLVAMGVPHEQIFEAVRFSLGRFNSSDEIDFAINKVISAVEFVRSMQEGD